MRCPRLYSNRVVARSILFKPVDLSSASLRTARSTDVPKALRDYIIIAVKGSAWVVELGTASNSPLGSDSVYMYTSYALTVRSGELQNV